MNHPDTLIHLLGALYGALLVAAMFMRAPLTEALRIDALFVPSFSEKTRPLNLVAGLLIAGYAAYSLLSR
ncbi:MAG TPA: hypothetical protein PLL19_10615 [Thiobacillaceae bacterium]|nr:hypothetical protein [Thiobacillaceae bacterium]HNA81453.1 hypothetical protein [Thiobacillaceae bacterium]HNF89774.1 hypothetical protein [Thiobacillaceae bacterium]HNH89636.1 hypothetical protein [Thiobacillaceae bacterium]HNI08088.1 hypothetical protein [Thiobacillaceae bacterium]